MARPRKSGIDYFPFDTDFFSDNKIRILRARFGVDGLAVYIFILCEIYREGYYLTWNDDTEYIVADELGMSHEKVKQVMTFLYGRSLLTEMSILPTPDTIVTSAGIQRRYQLAVEERARKLPIEVDSNIWLLDPSETRPWLKVVDLLSLSGINGSLSELNSDKSAEKVHKVKESKVKESKVKESKVEDDSEKASSEIDPLSSVFSLYTKEIDAVPSTYVASELDALQKAGMETDVMLHAIKTAADNNVRKWAYVRAILKNFKKEGVLTMDAVNQREREFQQSKHRNKEGKQQRDNRDNFTWDDDLSPDETDRVRMPRLKKQEGDNDE